MHDYVPATPRRSASSLRRRRLRIARISLLLQKLKKFRPGAPLPARSAPEWYRVDFDGLMIRQQWSFFPLPNPARLVLATHNCHTRISPAIQPAGPGPFEQITEMVVNSVHSEHSQ